MARLIGTRSRLSQNRKWMLRLGSLLVFAAAWEAFGRSAHSLLLPTFTDAVLALASLLTRAETWTAVWLSNQALILGYVMAVVVGVSLGLLLGRSLRLSRCIEPYLYTQLVTPTSSLIPFFIVALGLGLTSRALFVFVTAFVVIVVNTQAGVRQVEPSLVEMARSFGATEQQLWRTVTLPGALPAVMAGLRLGLGRAISAMVQVELLFMAVGLGRLLLDFQARFESDYAYAVILIVLAEAILLSWVVRQAERRLAPWEATEHSDD